MPNAYRPDHRDDDRLTEIQAAVNRALENQRAASLGCLPQVIEVSHANQDRGCRADAIPAALAALDHAVADVRSQLRHRPDAQDQKKTT